MMLVNQWNFDYLQGDITFKTRNAYVHILQPMVPIGLGDDWILVTRPTLSFIYDSEIPMGLNDFDHRSGIGDVVLFSLLGKSIHTDKWGGGDLVVAGGFTSQFPTASDEFATNRYQAGPAGVAAFIGKKFILGALPQHWWSYAKVGPGSARNFTNIQYFYWLNLPGGWQVGGAPQIEIDWKAEHGDRLSFPIGLGVQKVHFFPGLPMPIKLGVEVQKYVASPDTLGKDWRMVFTFTPILPNLFTEKGRAMLSAK